MEICDNKDTNGGFCWVRTWSGNEVSWKTDFQNSEDQLNSFTGVDTESLAACGVWDLVWFLL